MFIEAEQISVNIIPKKNMKEMKYLCFSKSDKLNFSGKDKSMGMEIIFRAWDKKTHKMRAVNSIAFHYEEENFDYDDSRLPKVINLWEKDIILHREEDEVILMQYTNSKDKNGKNIYDGDYVRCNGINYEIYWSDIWNAWFARELFTSNNDFLSKIITDNIEVIGNVFETPLDSIN